MNEYSSPVVGRGTRLQSGIPTRRRRVSDDVRGLILRGVVTATYRLDDDAHPMADSADATPRLIYCDVLTYGSRYWFIRRALVNQMRGGMHSGRIWEPRAATLDITGNPIDLNQGTNPANLDGDHVLVSFLDGNVNQPLIIGALQHPHADLGNEEKDVGHRMRLKEADGDPDFWKHHGGYYGISDDGDYVIDLTEAFSGKQFQTDGKEPPPLEDGSTGNYVMRLPKGSTVTIEIEEGETITIAEKDGNASLKLGDGAKSAIIAEAWQTFWDNFANTVFNVHTHLTPTGPSGFPVVTASTYPSNATSTKLTIPDG